MSGKIKVILADDHKMFLEGIRFLLSKLSNIEVIAEAQNGKQLIGLLNQNKPDVILMDINMPLMDGIEATKLITSKYPEIKVIALSMNGEEHYYYKMIRAGAKGFVLKQSGSEELEEAINKVMEGASFFSPELMQSIIVNFDTIKKEKVQNSIIKLTDREKEVLPLICSGVSIKEIADKLFISPRTVEGHKAHIMEKLGAKNISSLIILAIKNKLIEI